MNRKQWKSAFSYCFTDILHVLITAVGIYALVCLGIGALDLLFPENVNVRAGNGGAITMSYAVTVVITLFVTGIAGVRDYLRMLVQHGRSRKTAILAYLLGAAAVSAAATALFFVLYLGEHCILGIEYYKFPCLLLMLLLVKLNAMFWGSTISLLFWRLPKRWKVVAAVGLPVFFFYILPLASVNTEAESFFLWLFSSYGPMLLMAFVTAAAAAILCIVLSRSVDIRAAA